MRWAVGGLHKGWSPTNLLLERDSTEMKIKESEEGDTVVEVLQKFCLRVFARVWMESGIIWLPSRENENPKRPWHNHISGGKQWIHIKDRNSLGLFYSCFFPFCLSVLHFVWMSHSNLRENGESCECYYWLQFAATGQRVNMCKRNLIARCGGCSSGSWLRGCLGVYRGLKDALSYKPR